MELKIEYFEGEERDGFYVQPLMKRAWAAHLEVLKEIDAICKRHDIKYVAQWGTLLGAVRHKGFIPWDDDMDIAMIREDFEKFLHYGRQELPKGWLLRDFHDDYDALMARVVNSSGTSFEESFLGKFHGCPYAVGVDIFCLDHIPKNKEAEEMQLNLLKVVHPLGVHWDSYVSEIGDNEIREMVRDIEEATGYPFDWKRPMKMQVQDLADQLASMYCDEESDEVAQMSVLYRRAYRIPVSYFDRIIEVPFENTTIPIIEDYDFMLRLNYGKNYMRPVKKWPTHEYPYFRNQIETLRNIFNRQGQELPECFDIKMDEKTEQ